MDFALTDEQVAIGAAARAHLAGRYPPWRIAELAGDPVATAADDREGWPRLRRQGWLDGDLGTVTLGLLALECGYALAPSAWVTTAGAVAALPAATRPEPADRPELAGPVVLAGPDDYQAAPDPGDTAGPTGRWRLSGGKLALSGAGAAGTILLAAGTPDGPAIFAVDPGSPGVELTPLEGLDPLRAPWRLRLTAAPGHRLASPAQAAEGLYRARLRGRTLLACEAVGVARRALDLAVEHAGTRVQFGRPIGAFQAVSHRLADAYADVELARSLAYRAAWHVERVEAESDLGVDAEPGRPAPVAVAAAAVAAVRAAVSTTESAQQVLGALGASWEHPLHWWYRRALSLRAALSGDDLEIVAAAVLDG